MSEEKRLRLTWIFFAVTVVTTLVDYLIDLSNWLNGFVGGLGLVAMLMALGYSTKLLSSMTIKKNTRAQCTLIMLLTVGLFVYGFIL